MVKKLAPCAMFQNCYGPGTAVCLPFSATLSECSFPVLAFSLSVGCVRARKHVPFVHTSSAQEQLPPRLWLHQYLIWVMRFYTWCHHGIISWQLWRGWLCFACGKDMIYLRPEGAVVDWTLVAFKGPYLLICRPLHASLLHWLWALDNGTIASMIQRETW